MKKVLSVLFFVLLLISCKKDDDVLTGPDRYVGTYSGRITTILSVDGVWVQFSEVPTTKTIERVNGTDNLVLSKGTDMEFNAIVESGILEVQGRPYSLLWKDQNILVNFLLSGQGSWIDKKELLITYSSILKVGNSVYKLTIEESLSKPVN